MIDQASKYLIRAVRTDFDVESLRLIRNSARLHFTHDQGPIAPSRQRDWWLDAEAAAGRRVWLWCDEHEIPRGFVMLRVRHEQEWLTCALEPAVRGRGLGALMLDAILGGAASGDIWAEVQPDNLASLKTLGRCGFVRVYPLPGGDFGCCMDAVLMVRRAS